MKISLKFLEKPLIELEFRGPALRPLRQDNSESSRQEVLEGGEGARVQKSRFQRIMDWLLETDGDEPCEPNRSHSKGGSAGLEAVRDQLTGAFTRQYFEEILASEQERARRHGHSIGFLMVDLEGVEDVRHRHSRMVCDQILQGVADWLKENLEASASIIRYDSRRFLIMLPDPKDHLDSTLEEIKKGADALCTDFAPGESISFALGKSQWCPEGEKDLDQVLREAENGLCSKEDRTDSPLNKAPD